MPSEIIELRRLVADDAHACTFQTFGQYRTALLKAIDAAAQAGTTAAEPAVIIDFKQATELLAMFGGEPGEVTLLTGDGHSGRGLYAHHTEHPEEGAEFLGATDGEAIPTTLSHPAAQAGAVQAVACLPFAILSDELAALHRFYETTEDGQDYDVPVPMMKRLAVIGLVRRVTGNRYEFTDFGLSVRNGDFSTLAATQPSAAPVAVVEPIGDGQGEAMLLKALPIGTLLYAAPGQGWQSVPVTPTEEMELAGCVPAGSIGEARETWKAMLAAAPASAAPEDGQGAAEITGYRWRYIDHKGLTQNHWSYTPDDPREWRSWASGTEPQWGVNAECIAMVDAAPGAAIAAREQEPEGWRLIKLATTDERSWPEDYAHENGHYFNTCYRCQRQFMGHKRRVECKACGQTPAPASRSEAPEARPNAAGQEQGEQS